MKLRSFILLLAMILLFSSCAKSPSEVSVSEETVARPNTDDAESFLYVNVSAKKIHYDPNCRYLKVSKEDNISRVAYTEKGVQDLISMAYDHCNNCRHPDFLT